MYREQPGETYTVEITPYHLHTCILPHSALSLMITIKGTACASKLLIVYSCYSH